MESGINSREFHRKDIKDAEKQQKKYFVFKNHSNPRKDKEQQIAQITRMF